MKLSIIERTEINRGDHGADVAIAHEYKASETIEDMIVRCLSRSQHKDPKYEDWLEIRVIKEEKP